MKKILSLPYLAVILTPFILFSPLILKGEALFWGVPSLQFIPWKVYALESLRQGILPLWNPLNGMGSPLIANYQLAFFYPPNWILFLLYFLGGVSWMAWGHTLLAAAHLAWAGVGMIRLLKRLGFPEASQAISGISFALSGYLVARTGFFSLVWAASWLPWIIHFACDFANPLRNDDSSISISKAEGGNTRSKFFEVVLPWARIFLPLSVCITFQLLAGHAQVTYYSLLFLTAWVILSGYQQNRFKGSIRALSLELLAILFALSISAIQLLPTAELLLQSQRSGAVDYAAGMTYSFWPWRLLTLLAPNLFGNPGTGDYWGYANYWEDAVYIGLLPVILAILTLFRALKKKDSVWKYRPLVIFLWVTIGIVFILALGKNTPIYPFLYRYIPTFDMFQAPTRLTILAEFCLALLAGIGLQYIKKPEGRGLYWLRLSIMGGVAITVGAFLAWQFLQEIKSTFVIATAMTGLWAVLAGVLILTIPVKFSSKKIWEYFAIGIVVLDLLAADWNLNPGINSAFYSTPSSVSTQLRADLNGGRLYLSYSDDYDLKYERFLSFESFSIDESWSNLRNVMLANLNLLDGISSLNNFDPLLAGRYDQVMKYIDGLDNTSMTPWLQMMGASIFEKIDTSRLTGVRFDPVNRASRFWWYACAIHVKDGQAAWQDLKQGMLAGNIEKVIWEDGTSTVDQNCDPGSFEYEVLLDKPQVVVVQIRTSREGYFVLADTLYPGWRASLDGTTAVITPANYLFRGVKVEPGSHTLAFNYAPVSFLTGSIITGISLVLLLLVMSILFISKQRFES